MTSDMAHRIDEARDRTAHAMRGASRKLRSGSKTTARAIQRGGSRGADMLEASERVVRTDRAGGRAGRKVLMFAVIAFAIGVLAAILLSRNGGAGADEPGYVS